MASSDWFLLGAPWDCSGTGRGEMQAPGALRDAGLTDLADVDLGDAATVITNSRRDEATGVWALSDTIAAAHALTTALWIGVGDHPVRALSIVVAKRVCSRLYPVISVATLSRSTGLTVVSARA